MECFVLVLVLWVFSVCLHEYGHAKVAQLGGDYTVEDKGYLSMNPIHYANPFVSFVIPMAFLLMGGIALPGGAVYIDCSLLRSTGWKVAVALAGPGMNLLLAILLALSLDFFFVPRFPYHVVTYSLAFALQLQISSILFNLIPIPSFDGFNAIAPLLNPDLENVAYSGVGNYGTIILYIAFSTVPALSHGFWTLVAGITGLMGVDPALGLRGLEHFEFWRG